MKAQDLSGHWIVRLLKIPPRPQPPAGSPGSLQVFQAARNFYRYLLLQWVLRQVGAVAGIAALLFWDIRWFPIPTEFASKIVESTGVAVDIEFWIHRGFVAIEWFGLAVLILQMPFTLMLVRLNYRLRWYMVTDRSLRIREGVSGVREMTLTFANIQNLQIEQGPIQRLLGLSDLKVRTAGGGSSDDEDEDSDKDSMHVAYFHGIDNAHELRDSMLERIRSSKRSGLGDPDEPTPDSTTDAAREVLAEVRRLRGVLT